MVHDSLEIQLVDVILPDFRCGPRHPSHQTWTAGFGDLEMMTGIVIAFAGCGTCNGRRKGRCEHCGMMLCFDCAFQRERPIARQADLARSQGLNWFCGIEERWAISRAGRQPARTEVSK
jgi:hypothetical protein